MPSRKRRFLRNALAPLLFRLVQTNRPEIRNISAMRNPSLNLKNAAAPLHRSGSTTGKACHQCGTAFSEAGGGGAKGWYANTA